MEDHVAPRWVEPALLRLAGAFPLEDKDLRAARLAVGPPVDHRPGADLGDDGDDGCRFLTAGWACRARRNPWGRRQILDILLPGDAIGLSAWSGLKGLYRVAALTRGTTLDGAGVRNLIRRGDVRGGLATVAAALERNQIERMLDHTGRVGGGTAYQGMGRLFLELRTRLTAVNLMEGKRFPMLLTQDVLGEFLDITPVQVNRVLGQFRREGLMALGPGWVEIPDPQALAAAIGLKEWKETTLA